MHKPSLLLAVSLLAPAPASSSSLLSENFVYARSAESQDVFQVGWQSAPIVFEAESSLPFGVGGAGDRADSTHAATASALQQTLRARATLVSYTESGWSYSAKTEGFFRKEVYVDPGTSGLQPGDPVRLDVALSLDGLVGAGFYTSGPAIELPAGFRILTSVDTVLDYTIVDLDDVVCGGGCAPAELARFGYGGRLLSDYEGASAGDTYSYSLRSRWEGTDNVNGSVPGGDEGEDKFFPQGWFDVPPFETYALDTGVVALQIDTFVGHTLRIKANLDVFAQAFGSYLTATSSGDYESTFDAALTSSVPGIALLGEAPGVHLVPEPGASSAVAAALLGLALLRRAR